MQKTSLKWISALLTAFMLVAAIIPAAAAAENQPEELAEEPVFTYEQALNEALKYSPSLRGVETDLQKAIKVRDAARENAEDAQFNEENVLTGLYYQLSILRTQTDIQRHIQRRQVIMERERIAYQVRDRYNAVLRAEIELQTEEMEEAFQEQKHRIDTYKRANGILSRRQEDSSARNLETAREKRREAEKKVENAYHNFNQLVGKSVSSRPNLEMPEYEPRFRESLSYYQNRARNTSVGLEAAEQQINLARLDRRITDTDNPLNPTSAEVKDLEVKRAEISVDEQKRQLDDAVRSLYAAVEEMELQREQLLIQREELEQQVELTALYYDLGMITRLEKQEAELGLEQLDRQLKIIALEHSRMLMALMNPFAAQ